MPGSAISTLLINHQAAQLLPAEIAASLAEQGTLGVTQAGQTVSVDDQVLFIVEGALGDIPAGGPCVGLYGPGAVVGLESAFSPTVSAGLTAIFRTEWVAITGERLNEIAGPAWVERMFAHQSIGRQRWLAGELSCVAKHTAASRLAKWLLWLENTATNKDIRITQAHLATMLAMQRTTVVSAMKALQRQEAIKVGRGILSRIDRAILQACSCDCRRPFDAPG